MGEAPLQMLTDHVNVLEVSLYEVAFVDRRHATGIVDCIDDVDGESNRMCRSQAQSGTPIQGDRARRRPFGPDLADSVGEERPARSELGLDRKSTRLNSTH